MWNGVEAKELELKEREENMGKSGINQEVSQITREKLLETKLMQSHALVFGSTYCLFYGARGDPSSTPTYMTHRNLIFSYLITYV